MSANSLPLLKSSLLLSSIYSLEDFKQALTTEVQKLIYSQGAIPYTAPEEEGSLAERFSNYMIGDADLLVIVVPVCLLKWENVT